MSKDTKCGTACSVRRAEGDFRTAAISSREASTAERTVLREPVNPGASRSYRAGDAVNSAVRWCALGNVHAKRRPE